MLKLNKVLFQFLGMLLFTLIVINSAWAQLPDLAVTNVYFKVDNKWGKCRLMITIANNGGPISDSVFNRIYLARLENNGEESGGYKLSVLDKRGVLKHPGGKVTVGWWASLYNDGNYKLGAYVDSTNVLVESNEKNNIFGPIPLRCEVRHLPDLKITDISLTSDCRVKVRVKNIGGELPDRVWTIHSPKSPGVLLFVNGKSWGGESIWSFDSGKQLKAPGGTATYVSNLKIKTQGKVKAVVDYWNKIAESNENNNSREKTLRCNAGKPLPDLVITKFGLWKWGECRPYHKIMTFAVTIKNIGNAPSPNIGNKVLVQVMDRDGSNWGNGAVVGSLRPGASKTVYIPVYYLMNNPQHMVKNAPHPFRAEVDPLHLVKESNENNNLSGVIRVGAPQNCKFPKTPDLGLYGYIKIGRLKRQVDWNRTIILTPNEASVISNGRPAFMIYYGYREYNGGAAAGFKNEITFNSRVVSIQRNLAVNPKEIKHVATQAYIGPQDGTLCIKIDAGDNIPESRENNNFGCVKVKFEGFSSNQPSSHLPTHMNKMKNMPRKQPRFVLPKEKVEGGTVMH